MLRELSYEELKELEKDINNRCPLLKDVLWQRMREISNYNKFCIVCFSKLDENKIEINFRSRRINFCAPDCLEFFMSHIKEMRRTK